MKKQAYLAEKTVASFIDWLANHIAKSEEIQISNSFKTAKTKQNFHFKSLEDALLQYQWGFQKIDNLFKKGNTYPENELALSCLESGLKSAVQKQDVQALKIACINVFKWGGVVNGNQKWAENDPENILKEISKIKTIIEKSDDTLNQSPFPFRFNAGMTKVYSLLLPNFVIYDSRVAGTLAWLITCWSKFEGCENIPEELRFACMDPKEGVNSIHKKIRNPDKLIFPKLNNSALQHAIWNMRASWILESVAEKISHFENAFHQKKNPMRALEAAMFMWGYDLSNSEFQNK